MATMMLASCRDFQDRLQIEKRVELAGVPDHALAGGGAEQGDQDALEILPFAERRPSAAAAEVMPALLICVKMGDSFICIRM